MAEGKTLLLHSHINKNSKFNLKSIIMLKGWKTILFNVLSGAILIAQSQGVDVWGLTPELVSTVVVVGNFLLRFLTTTSVGSKE